MFVRYGFMAKKAAAFEWTAFFRFLLVAYASALKGITDT